LILKFCKHFVYYIIYYREQRKNSARGRIKKSLRKLKEKGKRQKTIKEDKKNAPDLQKSFEDDP